MGGTDYSTPIELIEFVTFLNRNTNGYTARPSDVIELPDGSILIADNYGDMLYRVWYPRTFSPTKSSESPTINTETDVPTSYTNAPTSSPLYCNISFTDIYLRPYDNGCEICDCQDGFNQYCIDTTDNTINWQPNVYEYCFNNPAEYPDCNAENTVYLEGAGAICGCDRFDCGLNYETVYCNTASSPIYFDTQNNECNICNCTDNIETCTITRDTTSILTTSNNTNNNWREHVYNYCFKGNPKYYNCNESDIEIANNIVNIGCNCDRFTCGITTNISAGHIKFLCIHFYVILISLLVFHFI